MANSGSFNTNAYDGRYLTFAWSVSSQSVANNSTTISWSLNGAGGSSVWYKSGNFKVVINGTTVYSSSARIELSNGTRVASGTFTIAHGSDGSKTFSASAEAGIYYVAVNCRGSGSWSLPQIARQATVTSAPDFTDEQNPTIKYSNPAGNAVSSLQACIAINNSAEVPYRDVSKTGTSYTFNLTQTERNTLRNASKNSKTITVQFYLKTVISGQTFYSYVTKTMTIVNAAPALGAFTYRDTNSATTSITENNQIIIRSNSKLEFTVGAATALKGATISKYVIVFNNVSYTLTAAGTQIINNPNVSGNTTATLTVTDSRGFASSKSLTVTVWDWSLPYAAIALERHNNYYSETDLTVDAHYSSLNNKNSVMIQYQSKKVSDDSFSALTTIENNTPFTDTFDNLYQWNIRVIISDRLGSVTYNLVLDKGMPIVYFDRLKSSTGFNCFPVDEDSVEISGINILSSPRIVASGTSGIWTYRKWSDGTAECWGVHWFQLNLAEQFQNVWAGQTFGLNLPSGLFDSSTGYDTTNVQMTTDNLWSASCAGINQSQVILKGFSGYKYQNANAYVFISIKGRWKQEG